MIPLLLLTLALSQDVNSPQSTAEKKIKTCRGAEACAEATAELDALKREENVTQLELDIALARAKRQARVCTGVESCKKAQARVVMAENGDLALFKGNHSPPHLDDESNHTNAGIDRQPAV